MIELNTPRIEAYLKQTFGQDARLLESGDIGTQDEQGIKTLGYGKPLLVAFEAGGEKREAVISVMRGDKYGHQFSWDRAAILMFQYETSARMEKHVRPMGLGVINEAGEMQPMNEPREFFIVNEKLEGHDYFQDLERIRGGDLRDSDRELAREFGRWLARVHSTKHDAPDLYRRRVRDLIGASECIMGLIDEAFPHPYEMFPEERFVALEKKLVDWRYKLNGHTGRLCAVHGDFHPWNVLVTEKDGKPDFHVLDRSRGEWGEAADDLACMAINYLLFGIRDEPRLSGPFETLYKDYFQAYLDATGDTEILSLMAPFFVFRGLVIASPEWYAGHPENVRKGLLSFMENVLEDEVFDWQNINKYME